MNTTRMLTVNLDPRNLIKKLIYHVTIQNKLTALFPASVNEHSVHALYDTGHQSVVFHMNSTKQYPTKHPSTTTHAYKLYQQLAATWNHLVLHLSVSQLKKILI